MNLKEHLQIEKQLEAESEKQRQLALNKQRAREILLAIKFSLGSQVTTTTIKRKIG